MYSCLPQQVEPFICDCISVSKHLANAIEPFTQEDVPETIQEAEESLNIHKLTRQKTLDSLHIEDLTTEGEKINERMKQSVCQTVQANPDFESTLGTIQKLLSQIDMVKGKLETLWETRHSKLEVNLKQRVFEKEAKQVWCVPPFALHSSSLSSLPSPSSPLPSPSPPLPSPSPPLSFPSHFLLLAFLQSPPPCFCTV